MDSFSSYIILIYGVSSEKERVEALLGIGNAAMGDNSQIAAVKE